MHIRLLHPVSWYLGKQFIIYPTVFSTNWKTCASVMETITHIILLSSCNPFIHPSDYPDQDRFHVLHFIDEILAKSFQSCHCSKLVLYCSMCLFFFSLYQSSECSCMLHLYDEHEVWIPLMLTQAMSFKLEVSFTEASERARLGHKYQWHHSISGLPHLPSAGTHSQLCEQMQWSQKGHVFWHYSWYVSFSWQMYLRSGHIPSSDYRPAVLSSLSRLFTV